MCHGRRSADTIAEVAPSLDAPSEAALLDTGEEIDVDGLVIVPGAAELLAGARSRTRGRSSRRATAPSHGAGSRRSASRFPDVLVTGDVVEHGKPHPEGFLRAAAVLGVEPAACVVVEDAPAGIAAGRTAGARVVGVTTTHTADALRDADVIVQDLRGLDEALQGRGARDGGVGSLSRARRP